MSRWVALLRGINLGRRRLKMDELRLAFEQLGLARVRTVLASGNVLFDEGGGCELALEERVEGGLEAAFGFAVPTVVRSADSLLALVDSGPFAGARSSADTKYYVYFSSSPLPADLGVPRDREGDYAIVGQTARELFAVAYRQPNGRFGEGLDGVGRALGSLKAGARVTNRNWNTVLRLADAVSRA